MAEERSKPRMAIRADNSWLVKNLDTGEERYVTSHADFGQPVDPKKLKDQPWKRWWQEKRQKDVALLNAAEAGDETRLRELLATDVPVDVNRAEERRGLSALHLAASASTGAVKTLVEARAWLEQRSQLGTALHHAALRNSPETVRELLSARADANVAQEGMKALDLAATPEIVAELEPHTRQDSYTRTGAYGILRRNSRPDAVRRLLAGVSQGGGSESTQGESSSEPQRCSLESVASARSLRSGRSYSSVSSGSILRLKQTESARGPGSFEFVLQLGRGAFGEVYQVKQKATGQSYAMKVLHKEKILSRNLLRYAFTERNILSYIRHPYIVSMHYAFQTQKHLVLVLQLCPGGNLQQLIRRKRDMAPALAQLYEGEMLLALAHLHERKIVYRDLKPDNVVLDEEGHGLLTDFGLSKDGVCRHLGTRTHCGSVAYLAPEILLGQRYSHTVDIYNLGVLLYNMLIGIPPFFHHQKETLQRNILHAKLELPSCLATTARAFISSAMARQPASRLGAGSTLELAQHPFFADLDFELLMQRKVPVPMEKPNCASLEVQKDPGMPKSFQRSDGGVAGWDFEACQMDSCPVRPRPRRRLRICGLRW